MSHSIFHGIAGGTDISSSPFPSLSYLPNGHGPPAMESAQLVKSEILNGGFIDSAPVEILPSAQVHESIRQKFGFMFDGEEFFMHEKGVRYPISGVLVLEDGVRGLHIVFLSGDQSGMSSTIPLDAVTSIYKGKSPKMSSKPWIHGDENLFFAIATDDTIWDLESKEEGTSELWLASLSRVTGLKPIIPPPPPSPAPQATKIVPAPLSTQSSQSDLKTVPSILGIGKTPAQTRWGQWKRGLKDDDRISVTGESMPEKSEAQSTRQVSTMNDNFGEFLKAMSASFKEMAAGQGQAIVDAAKIAAQNRDEVVGPVEEIPEKPEKWYMRAFREVVLFTDTNIWTVITLIATLWAIFGPDIYMASSGPKGGDVAVYSISFIVFILFVFELVVFFFGKPEYKQSFFFILDIIAAISLIPDFMNVFGVQVFPGGQLALARAGRAARAGTRAARLVRIIKLIQLLSRRKDEKDDIQKPSRIGTRMGDLISQKVIVIIVLMLLMSTFTDLIANTYTPDITWDLYRFESLVALSLSQNGSLSVDTRNFTQWYVSSFLDNWQDNLLYLEVKGLGPPVVNVNTDNYRSGELSTFWTDLGSSATLDFKDSYRRSSITNIVQVLFVILILAISSVLFSRDTQRLVIAPLESMSDFVNRIVQNPLMNVSDTGSVKDETHFVASAIKKFLRLLQIALGDAGASIMSANLGSNGHMTAVVPGRKVRMVFGFCDIRNFTDCTECLQEDVMVFVNTIAKIVHFACKENEGSPNKNIGDAFLLAWAMPERRKKDKDETKGEKVSAATAELLFELEEEKKRRNRLPIPDHALKTFVQVICECAHSQRLKELTQNPALQQRLPGYQTTMGFGLHVGWAIEGAIGSELKIDASYLSPNVNMAARLEAATKQFGVPILMTDSFWMAMTSQTRSLCRRLDRVTVKGSNQPISLYTYDAVVRNPEDTNSKLGMKQNVRTFFDNNPPLHNAIFRNRFNKAVDLYIEGDWNQSKTLLRECFAEFPDDKPTQNLLNVMTSHGNKPPSNWEGYRELTEK